MDKVCSKCKVLKNHNEFYKNKKHKDGLKSSCKECCKLNLNSYRSKNKDEINKMRRSIRKRILSNSPSSILTDIRFSYFEGGLKRCPTCGELKTINKYSCDKRTPDKLYYQCKPCRAMESVLWSKNNNGKRLDICKNYRIKNPHYKKNRCAIDVKYKTEELLRGRFNSWMKSKNVDKRSPMEEIIGCNKSLMINRLLNMGYISGIHHIDHIIPLSRFDCSNINHVRIAWNYLNLQPLLPDENIKKSDSLMFGWETIIVDICNNLAIPYDGIIMHIKGTLDN